MSRSHPVARLRALAVAVSLGRGRGLDEALPALGFVQYDPIRRPARAQDLILGQRVAGYRAGDLDRHYPTSGLTEDYFYAYGALRPALASLLHPRPDQRRPDRPYQPTGLAAEVLDYVRCHHLTHPRGLAETIGRSTATNDWGGVSAATTRALTELHYHGLIRVARREQGVRVYEPAAPANSELTAAERLRRLALAILRLLAPVAESGLRRAVSQLCDHSGGLAGRRTVIAELARAPEVTATSVDGVRYFLPADLALKQAERVPDRVRFLAPFDPVVWERDRFEHLWGWCYRFEAYTPPRQRRFGYYALPLFWRDRAVGWVNLELTSSGKLDVDCGLAGPRPRGRAYQQAFDREVARYEQMLSPRSEGTS